MRYRLLISMEVVEFVERLPSRQRKPLRSAIAAIGEDPFACSDATDFDDTGRSIHIRIAEDFALMYWIDDVDRHVKILDIHASDR
ncbi:MAG: type II toxin-antitoxin system RelE family toxin [Verrucomicrobiales bacterium]